MFPVLQASGYTQSYTPPVNSQASLIFLIIVVSVIVIFLVIGRRFAGNSSSRKSGAGAANFKRTAREYGLEGPHFKILKRAVKDQKIETPTALFTNARFLNSTLKVLIKQVEESGFNEGEKEALKSEILEIKARIAEHTPGLKQNYNTRSMMVGQELTIFSKSFPPLSSELNGKTGEYLAITLPHDAHGERPQFAVGAPLKIRYIRDEGKVYSFVTQVKEIRDVDGEALIILPHTDQVRRVQLRKSPRKEIQRTVFFYRVEVITEGSGRKEQRKAAIDKNRRLIGSMEDISTGGCAVFSRTPLPKGSLIMVSFDISKGKPINVFGKVRGISKEKVGSLMRIMFTKTGTRHLNEIRSYVFGLGEEEEKPRNQYLIP